MRQTSLTTSSVFTAKFLKFSGLFIALLWSISSFAAVYDLPEKNSRLLGEPLKYQVEQGDFFQALAEYHNVGFLALMAANTGIDPFLPKVGIHLNIPKQMLLPYGERKGIVINLAELRLYYFPPKQNIVYVFPVGIGREGLSTPELISVIGDKRKNPVWRPTQAMRKRYFAEHGKPMADFIAAGPDNPFGKYALRLGTSEYLIHGSNKRFGIGTRASSGCIRMYDEDIEWVFHNVTVGTPVRIIHQAIKMSYEPSGKKLIEVHQPLSGRINVKDEKQTKSAIAIFLGKNEKAKKQYLDLVAKPDGLVTLLAKAD
jgi:L,D-transpeptidase ErfK/SrfK/L,D-transpeptidase YbiS